MKTEERRKGIIFALIALFLWGIHGPAGRFLALRGINMYFVASLRFFIGAGVFFIYLLYKKKVSFKIKNNVGLVLLISLVGICGNSILYHLTLIYLPATLVMIFENLSPVFVLLFSLLLLKIKPNRSEIISLILSISGIILIVLGKEKFANVHPLFYFGILLGVLTGITFGFYVYFSAVLVRPLKDDPDEIISYLFKIFLISALLMSPLLFTKGNLPSKFDEWFWLFEMGIFQSGLAYIFWNYALSLLPVNSASILFLLTIIFTTINEIVFLKLSLNPYLIAGGLLIMISGYVISVSLNKV